MVLLPLHALGRLTQILQVVNKMGCFNTGRPMGIKRATSTDLASFASMWPAWASCDVWCAPLTWCFIKSHTPDTPFQLIQKLPAYLQVWPAFCWSNIWVDWQSPKMFLGSSNPQRFPTHRSGRRIVAFWVTNCVSCKRSRTWLITLPSISSIVISLV